MNEVAYIYLKLEQIEHAADREDMIRDMDKLLLSVGLKYSGFRNMYLPQDEKRRDDIIFDAVHVLECCDWLKGIYDHMVIGNRCYDGKEDAIDCSGMAPPGKAKMAYYEEYYLKNNILPHNVLVDEDNRLVDGYCSFLLARKYGLKWGALEKNDIYQVESSVPHKKVVVGRHVTLNGNDVVLKGKKYYRWICDIKEPVVPGDVLLVNTGKGKDIMAVEKITYEAGRKNLSGLKKVLKRTGKKLNLNR